ncbi:phosphoribosyltransferase (plasmid) [Caballeronia sp. NK8]|uniref:phosphoribosyltransferase n=1 Tax=Caballeronia sp. NK8 TaxID=140098 RepID=UPI001BB7E40C|nr:phosphoribosyltransferase [Caballeronia sp. NK8]
MSFSFVDRSDAGIKLAHALHAFADRSDVVVLALPRGGVPVAVEIARMLNAPLDVLVVRKLGVPHDPELAMGAIASGGVTFINEPFVRAYRISPEQLSDVIAQQRVELQRRERLYCGLREPVSIEGKTVILVDDGIATGSSIRVALSTLRSRHAGHVVIAVPVAPENFRHEIEKAGAQFVCRIQPRI